jgi:hypothetical protein
MNVFVLCTGRSGSSGFIEACKHMTNFSAAHESLSHKLGKERLAFTDNHIEADNRLSWQLGQLEDAFGKKAFYVHLKRDQMATAKSFMNRFLLPKSMIYAYSNGIKKLPPEAISSEERLEVCVDFVKTVNTNITAFLRDKPRQMTIDLENIQEDFKAFWNHINAEGNLNSALREFDKKHNQSQRQNTDITYSFKHVVLKSKFFLDQIFK